MATQTYFLTGCASGIGKHLTGVLQKQGHSVYATDINFEGLEAVAKEAGWDPRLVTLHRLDVTDWDDWEDVYEDVLKKLGKVDVHMNIAGYLQSGWVHEAPVHEVHRHIDINAKGVVFGTQLAARHMITQGNGHIINIASIAGLAPIPGMALYSAAKFFVRSYTLAAAYELRPHNVFATAICPFSVATPLLFRQQQNTEASMMFAHRALTVEDIERAILKKALTRKSLEVWIPAGRGWLARFIDLFPGIARYVAPIYNARGRAVQEKFLKKESVSK